MKENHGNINKTHDFRIFVFLDIKGKIFLLFKAGLFLDCWPLKLKSNLVALINIYSVVKVQFVEISEIFQITQ